MEIDIKTVRVLAPPFDKNDNTLEKEGIAKFFVCVKDTPEDKGKKFYYRFKIHFVSLKEMRLKIASRIRTVTEVPDEMFGEILDAVFHKLKLTSISDEQYAKASEGLEGPLYAVYDSSKVYIENGRELHYFVASHKGGEVQYTTKLKEAKTFKTSEKALNMVQKCGEDFRVFEIKRKRNE